MLMKLATTLQVSLDWIVFGIAENPNTEIYRVLADCSEEELRIFTLVIKSLKSGLRSDQLSCPQMYDSICFIYKQR